MNLLRRLWRKQSASALPAARGGLALPRNKPGLPLTEVIATLALPEYLAIPLVNYRRETLAPLVAPGQQVRLGQTLAEGILASASGCITAIEPRPILHPSGRSELCVVIRPDESTPASMAVHPPLSSLTVQRLEACGVTGLGGAGFATGEKFATAQLQARQLDTLLINAVECEPMISCDEALLMCEAPGIIEAIGELMAMTRCRRCVLAIENDKRAAISALQDALAHYSIDIELQLLPPIYPSGAERTLIKLITGYQLTAHERPTDRGILCINVATALATRQARLGFALTSRIVTLAGESCANPVNVRVAFGTSVADVLRLSGLQPDRGETRIRVGGPLSGFDVRDLTAPVTASTNCIGLHPRVVAPIEQPCIRCSACSDVCPEQLLPQQLYWYVRADHLDGAQRFGLDSCIECACCDIVCPSAIPLTANFRHARDAHREQQRQDAAALAAEKRYLAREQRLAQRAAAREACRLAAKAKLTTNSDPIADALARARSRRTTGAGKNVSTDKTRSPDGPG